MRIGRSALLFSVFQALVVTSPVNAADKLPVIDMQHTSWTAAQGAPTGITTIAQTPDGWLWIGSSVGLFRFDGVRFERAEGPQAPISSSITGLGTLPDGRLWIAYKYGGASLMTNGRMRHFRVGEHNTPGGTSNGITQDGDGRLWLASQKGLMLMGIDGNWHAPEPAFAAPETNVASMLLDRGGVFWVRTFQAIYALPRNATRFEKRQEVEGFGQLVQHPDSSIWTSDLMRPGLHLVAGAPGSDPHAWNIDDNISYFAFDRQGNLWDPDSLGVGRMSPGGPKRLQHTGAEQGLSVP